LIPPRTAALVALSLALALPAGGCGDDSSAQFKEDYNHAVRPLSQLRHIGGSIGSAADETNQQLAKELDRLADRAEQTRTNLSRLEAPEDAKDEFQNLKEALGDTVRDLRGFAAAAKKGDPAEANKASKKLAESGEEVQQAEEDLRRAVNG
jgi:methyl-accepting chemotaxis protein